MVQHPFVGGGELALANAHVLRADLLSTIDGCADDLLLDCSALTFLDSSGVRVLIEAQTRLQETGRELRIVNLQAKPRRVFEALGLVDWLRIDA
jgi:anti-sigma B factor antagonist